MIRIPPALKHRRFFYLWLGLLISVAGTQMQIWAIFWHIRELTDKPIALGGVGLARIPPVIIFSLIGGAVADSLKRTRILFITQSAAALLAIALGLLTQFGNITIWHIYAITALQAVAIAFDGYCPGQPRPVRPSRQRGSELTGLEARHWQSHTTTA